MSKIQKWLNDMRDIWLSKTPDKMTDILSEELRYYEDPFQEPCLSAEEVVKEWQAIHEQNIEYVEIELLYEHDNVGVAQWKFKEKNTPLHVGCYFIQLNEEGKCIQFRQWWNS
jgi:hypothetical protein